MQHKWIMIMALCIFTCGADSFSIRTSDNSIKITATGGDYKILDIIINNGNCKNNFGTFLKQAQDSQKIRMNKRLEIADTSYFDTYKDKICKIQYAEKLKGFEDSEKDYVRYIKEDVARFGNGNIMYAWTDAGYLIEGGMPLSQEEIKYLLVLQRQVIDKLIYTPHIKQAKIKNKDESERTLVPVDISITNPNISVKQEEGKDSLSPKWNLDTYFAKNPPPESLYPGKDKQQSLNNIGRAIQLSSLIREAYNIYTCEDFITNFEATKQSEIEQFKQQGVQFEQYKKEWKEDKWDDDGSKSLHLSYEERKTMQQWYEKIRAAGLPKPYYTFLKVTATPKLAYELPLGESLTIKTDACEFQDLEITTSKGTEGYKLSQ